MCVCVCVRVYTLHPKQVQWVMKQADGLAGTKTEGINTTELQTAISLWCPPPSSESCVRPFSSDPDPTKTQMSK